MAKTTPLILFGGNALSLQAAVSIYAENFVNDTEDLKTETPDFKDASFEPDRWVLDGSFKFLPSPPHVGLYSSTLSDADGYFDLLALPYLQLSFDDLQSTEGLTFYFSESPEEYPAGMSVTFYNGVTEVQSDSYTPTSAVFSTGQAAADFDSISITFTSTNLPYRFLRLRKIDLDTVTRFTGANVVRARLVEEISPSATEIPMNALEFSLYSNDSGFSVVKPSAIYASLQQDEPIDVYETVNGSTIHLGRFYLDEWESKNESMANFTANDVLGVLGKTTYMGGLFFGSLTDALDGMLNPLGIGYEIDTFFEDYGLFGWIPICTCREALQQMMFAISSNHDGLGAVVTCSRSGVLRIAAVPRAGRVTEPDYTITKTQTGVDTKITLKPIVRGVELVAHEYPLEASATELFRGDLAVGVHTIILPGPAANFTITGGTLTTTHVNYVVVTVSVAGTVVVSGKKYVDNKFTDVKYLDPLNPDARENIKIDSVMPLPSAAFPNKTNFLMAYYAQRYKINTRLFASTIAPGDSVDIETQEDRYLRGIVEKMETDLTGGFVSDVEIVGGNLTGATSPIAVKFNGAASSQNLVSFPATGKLETLTQKTISVWVYFDGGTETTVPIVSKYNGTAGHEIWYFASLGLAGKIQYNHAFSTEMGIWYTTSTYTDLQEAWHHIAVTYDYSSASNVPIIYLDGAAVAITTGTAAVGAHVNDFNVPLNIGNRYYTGEDRTNRFNGLLKGLQYFDVILTPAEVASIAAGGSVTRGLVFDAFHVFTDTYADYIGDPITPSMGILDITDFSSGAASFASAGEVSGADPSQTSY